MLDRQQLVDLPNLGRNPFMMSKLAQNVTPVGDPHYNRMQDQSGSSQISIAGGPVRGNNYLLDGIPITDAANRAIIIPTLEAVEQVKVQSNTYDAEMARTGGGMFNTYLKSGTNDWHGSLFGTHAADQLGGQQLLQQCGGHSRCPSSPTAPSARASAGRCAFRKSTTARTARSSGWRGKATTTRSRTTSQFSTPTALERIGDFSQSKTPGGALNVIYDPKSTVCAGSTCTRQPFAGNIIPADQLNPVGLAIAATYVKPQTASAFYGAPNLTQAAPLASQAPRRRRRSWITSSPTGGAASLSYLRYYSLEPGNTWFPTVSSPDQWRLERRVDTTQFNNILTHLADHGADGAVRLQPLPELRLPGEPGLQSGVAWASTRAYVAAVPSPTFPNVTMTSQYSLGTNNNFYYVHHSKNFSAGLAKYQGRHNLKGGFDYPPDSRRRQRLRQQRRSVHLQWRLHALHAADRGRRHGRGSGRHAAGRAFGGHAATFPTKLYEYADYYGAYFQDDIRITEDR